MAWSYSKLVTFESCKYHYKLRHIERIPEEKSPAADRGTAIHQMAEDFVTGVSKSLPTELMKFADDFAALRTRYSEGVVAVEQEWGMDRDWQPTAYKTGWLRMKADAVSFNKPKDPTVAIVIDFKTGKKFGNEIKHGEQVMLYAAATAIRMPSVQTLTNELWYLDKDELTTVTYTRHQALGFIKLFDKRAAKIDSCKSFDPNPNVFTCQYCPYAPSKGGQCTHAITTSLMSISDYRKKFA